jgi:hypothetical protein
VRINKETLKIFMPRAAKSQPPYLLSSTLTHPFELGLENDIVRNIAKLEQLVMVRILLDDSGREGSGDSQDACRSFW